MRSIPPFVLATLLLACGGTVETEPLGGGADGASSTGGSGGNPTTLGDFRVEASGQMDPDEIVADEKSLYWTNRGTSVDNQYPLGDGSVVRLSLKGGAVEALFTGGSPNAIAADESFVYFSDGQAVRRVPKRGGASEVISLQDTDEIALDASFVYTASSGAIRRTSKTGGDSIELVRVDSPPRTILVDDTHVYWAEYAGVKRAAKAGGDATVIADTKGAWGLTLDGEFVVWSVFDDGPSFYATIFRTSRNGGDPEIIGADHASVYEIVGDGASVYWAHYVEGPVKRLTGDSITTLADNQTGIDLALSGSRLYWVDPYGDHDGGKIFSVEK